MAKRLRSEEDGGGAAASFGYGDLVICRDCPLTTNGKGHCLVANAPSARRAHGKLHRGAGHSAAVLEPYQPGATGTMVEGEADGLGFAFAAAAGGSGLGGLGSGGGGGGGGGGSDEEDSDEEEEGGSGGDSGAAADDSSGLVRRLLQAVPLPVGEEEAAAFGEGEDAGEGEGEGEGGEGDGEGGGAGDEGEGEGGGEGDGEGGGAGDEGGGEGSGEAEAEGAAGAGALPALSAVQQELMRSLLKAAKDDPTNKLEQLCRIHHGPYAMAFDLLENCHFVLGAFDSMRSIMQRQLVEDKASDARSNVLGHTSFESRVCAPA